MLYFYVTLDPRTHPRQVDDSGGDPGFAGDPGAVGDVVPKQLQDQRAEVHV